MPPQTPRRDAAFEQALQQVQSRDRHRLRRQLARARCDQQRAAVQAKVQASAACTQARLAARGTVTLSPGLPISERADTLARAVAEHQVVVRCGETGSG